MYYLLSTKSVERKLMNCDMEHEHLNLPVWITYHGLRNLIKNQNVDQNSSDYNNPNINIDPDNCFYGKKLINCSFYTEYHYNTRINTDNKAENHSFQQMEPLHIFRSNKGIPNRI